MKVQIIPDDFSQDEYNKAAKHPLQTWEWGEARKETGIEIVRIGEFEHDELQNVFLMTLHAIPKTPWKVGYIPRSVLPSKEVIHFLENCGSQYNIIFIKLEPNVPKNQSFNFQLSTLNLIESPHPLFPKWSQQLDISHSKEDLLKNMKSKTRYNIRLAKRKGVVIKEESNEKGFETFSKLYFETTRRQQYFGHTKKYHEIIWNHLKHNIAHILIAYFNDIPLSAYELFYFDNTLYYPYGGSSIKHREVMGSNLLMWEAICLGKKLGATNFDMWGSLPPNSDQKSDWGGFTRFKEGYGTHFVEFIGSFDLILNPALYPIYNIAHSVRQSILQAKSYFIK